MGDAHRSWMPPFQGCVTGIVLVQRLFSTRHRLKEIRLLLPNGNFQNIINGND
jgi:hypothetical protein